MYGILQPLTVTRKEIQRDDGAFFTQYELIAGERRLRASKLAGMEQVPVIIRVGQDSEQEKLELAIIENLQREDLNAVDRALAFKQLAEVFKLSHGMVAKKVGRSREYVSNTIRLLGLPDYMLTSLRLGDISEGHARTLLMLKDRVEEQDVVYREILLKKLSVREVERIVRKIASDKVRKKSWANTDAALIEIEREFTDTLGTRVQISKTDFGGKLTIDYFSDEDLQKLLAIVKSQGKITDFHTAGTESGEESSTTVIQKLVNATALELVADELEEKVSFEEVAPQADVLEEIKSEIQEAIDSELAVAGVEENINPEQSVPIVEEAVAYEESVPSVQEAIDSEGAVSEVLEEVVVESAQYAGGNSEMEFGRHAIDTNAAHLEHLQQQETPEEFAQRNEMKVPASNYVAEMSKEVPEDTYQATSAPQSPQVPLQASEKEKKDDDEDLYSMRNFSL